MISNVGNLHQYQTARRQLELKLERERHRVCAAAKEVYIPSGLLAEIPSIWNCSVDASKFLTLLHEKIILKSFKTIGKFSMTFFVTLKN